MAKLQDLENPARKDIMQNLENPTRKEISDLIISIELFLPFFPSSLENQQYLLDMFDECKLPIKEIRCHAGKNRDKMIYIFNTNYKGKLQPIHYARGVIINYKDDS